MDYQNTLANRLEVFANIMADNRFISASSQRQRLLKAMELLGSVTTFEAQRYLDIPDPAPRKLELLALGHNITMVWDDTITESGEKHRIGRYVLKVSTPDYQEAAL